MLKVIVKYVKNKSGLPKKTVNALLNFVGAVGAVLFGNLGLGACDALLRGDY